MRGLGTPTNGIYPGYLRRLNEGTIQAASAASASLGVWQLVTSDAAATVEAANYFNSWVADLPVGSIIMAVVGIGGTIKLKMYVVSANTGTVVTVALLSTAAG